MVGLVVAGVGVAGALVASNLSFQDAPSDAFSITVTETGIHELITRDALAFTRPDVRRDIEDEQAQADLTRFWDNATHFDGCEFGGGTAYINDQYRKVLDAMNPSDPDLWEASDEFGALLHPLQDIYSHSNWVEMGRNDLIDSGTGFWTPMGDWVPLRDDIIIGQGETLPAGSTITSSVGSKTPRLRLANGQTRHVLISGANDTLTGAGGLVPDDCHDRATVGHSALAKDTPERGGHTAARNLARRQTQHEWCRLLHMTRSRYGDAGPAIPLTLWPDTRQNANLAGTPCSTTTPAPIAVTVTPQRVNVSETTDGSEGELNLVLGMYTTDLTRSARTQRGGAFNHDDGDDVPADRLPLPMTLCVNQGQRVAVTMQGWDDDEPGLGGGDGVFNDKTPDNDDQLRGATVIIDPLELPGPITADGAHLDAAFSVTKGPDVDADGLDQCREQVLGTNPNVADTDGDGLSDGVEVGAGRNPNGPDFGPTKTLSLIEASATTSNAVVSTQPSHVIHDTSAPINLPGVTGGFLQTRTFVAEPGSPARGLHHYNWRVAMGTGGNASTPCVRALRVPHRGLPVPQNWAGTGTRADVEVITSQAIGTVKLASARIENGVAVFTFTQPVCPGVSSFFFGLTASGSPQATTATLELTNGQSLSLAARTPFP